MTNVNQTRIIFFIGIIIVVAIWELIAYRRPLTVAKASRWFNNLGIIILDSITLLVILPTTAIEIAATAAQRGWGLCHYLPIPLWTTILLSVLILDLVVYLQHLMFHAVPLLWQLHMVHHADLDIDVTTGLRFHPIEIIISMIIKMTVVAALGPPVLAVLIFEITLNATAMFNHGNIRIPEGLDHLLRLLVVTPDMHRVHHSIIIRETNSNFGFNFPWWDRLFGTYRDQPILGHLEMTIGLTQFRQAKKLNLCRLLLLPFTGHPGRYSMKYIGGDPEGVKNVR